MDPTKVLLSGVDLLKPLLGEAGFAFSMVSEGTSSGGKFARGEFKKADRILSLSYRYSLGGVTYSVRGDTLSHEDYLWANGVTGNYPGFSSEALTPFEHLRADFILAGSVFLTEPDDAFARLVEKCKARPARRGFTALGESR